MVKVSGYSEVDAMRDVDQALSKLGGDNDAQSRVIQWLASKYTATISLGGLRELDSVPSAVNQRAQDIKSFMIQKRPQNHYERVACLAYYLEKFKEMADVGTKDIVDANVEARLPKMSNPAVFIKHATHTYGYLNSLGQRRLAVSSRGEALVDALPDRAKVDVALADLPFGKKGRSGKKGKAAQA